MTRYANVIARNEVTKQSECIRPINKIAAPYGLAMTRYANVIARNEVTKQSECIRPINKIAAPYGLAMTCNQTT